MQYLAVIDAREILFVDSQRKTWVTIAWRDFRPGDRDTLSDRVAYEAVYYDPEGQEIMQRLQGEFARAVRLLAGRRPGSHPGGVVDFRRPGG
jgi:hypothetical protein